MTRNRPAITQIGRVQRCPDGSLLVAGWGLASCAAECACHRHPVGGHLALHEDQERGLLGLRRWTPCGCCRPWTAHELAAVVAELAAVEHVEVPR